eukprot:351694-Chlamydomonas_euryale.AAC.2
MELSTRLRVDSVLMGLGEVWGARRVPPRGVGDKAGASLGVADDESATLGSGDEASAMCGCGR